MTLEFDKKDWKELELADVIYWYQKNIPNEKQIEYGIQNYVTANHIDSDEITFNRFSKLIDGQKGPTITKHFEAGDLLLSTRSVALRKASVAPISGVTGEKLLVLRPKVDSALMQELFPFLIHTNEFWKFAQNSASGSVNKFTSWTKLREFKFRLPPLTAQKEISTLLNLLYMEIKSEEKLLKRLEVTLEAAIEEKIHGVKLLGKTISCVLEELESKEEMVFLSELGTVLKGKGIAKSEVTTEGVPCIRYGELYTRHNRHVREITSYISQESTSKSFKLKKNDALLAGSGETITEIGKSAVFIDNFDAYAGSDILILRPNNMDGIYFGYLLNSLLVRKQLNKLGTGATVMHIYGSDINKIKVPNKPIEEQVKIGVFLESINDKIIQTIEKIDKSKSLLKSIINQVF